MEALKDEEKPGQPIRYDDKAIGEVVALACSKAPEGRCDWKIRIPR